MHAVGFYADVAGESCHAAYTRGGKGSSKTANFVERGGDWHHLAVTWDSQEDGLTNIYMDGLLSKCVHLDRVGD